MSDISRLTHLSYCLTEHLTFPVKSHETHQRKRKNMASITTQQPEETSGVETTSGLSPLERRNSLEKHLQSRPDEQDLKDRHILLDTTAAPALQARQAELERQKITGEF